MRRKILPDLGAMQIQEMTNIGAGLVAEDKPPRTRASAFLPLSRYVNVTGRNETATELWLATQP